MRLGTITRDRRGQSEVVGVILLTAVIVILVVGAGALIIADWQSESERETKVNVASDLTATELTLRHMGGDSLDPEDVLVDLQGADRQMILDDENFDSNQNRFEPGSTWRYGFSPSLDGEVTVRVFDRATNTLLHEATYEVGQDGIIFEVNGDPETSTVENGETESYTVTQTFERGASQEVTAETTIEEIDGSSLDIDENDQTITGVADGESTVQAAFEDERDTVAVTVVSRPTLEISDVDAPETAERGDSVTISGAVENTGAAEADDADVDLTIIDSSDRTVLSDTVDTTVDAGETASISFEPWGTTVDDIGEYDVEVSSDNDTSTESLTVVEPQPSDLLNITEGDIAIGEGESFDQHLTWESVHEETVTLITEGDGTEPTRTIIEIDSGDVTPETLGFPEEGTLVEVADNLDEDTVTVEIDEQ